MLTQLLVLLGAVFNMLIDTIYKIFRSLLITFLVVSAIAFLFAFAIFGLVR